MFGLFSGQDKRQQVFSNIPNIPFAPGMLPEVRKRHPRSGSIIAAFDAKWQSATSVRSYSGGSVRIGATSLHAGQSEPNHLARRTLAIGELQIGINGIGFIGQAKSKSWLWDEIAKGEVWNDGLSIDLYEGAGAVFSRDMIWHERDADILSYLMGNLQAMYHSYGSNWTD